MSSSAGAAEIIAGLWAPPVRSLCRAVKNEAGSVAGARRNRHSARIRTASARNLISTHRWDRADLTGQDAGAHELILEQHLISCVVVAGGAVVRRDAEPCVAVPGDLLCEVPGRDVGPDACILEVGRRYAELLQAFEVHRVELPDANVERSVVVAVGRSWIQARLDSKDGAQDVGVHLVVLRGRDDAPLDLGREWRRLRPLRGGASQDRGRSSRCDEGQERDEPPKARRRYRSARACS